MVALRAAHPDEPAARLLFEGLGQEYARVYGHRTAGELSAREAADFLPPRGVLLLLTHGSETVAGGGLAPLGPRVAEVKRMWTSPEYRGQGHARAVLGELERRAVELGYRTLRLQTGALSEAAIALYRSAGYRAIQPFGIYREEPLARAFEKVVAADAGRESVLPSVTPWPGRS